MVPLRVAIQDNWINLDLLRFLRDQQISKLPHHECLRLQKILYECADPWSSAHFTSRINRRSGDFDTGLTLGGKSYTVARSLASGAGDIVDTAITSTSTARKMEVLISCIGDRLPAAPAEMLWPGLTRSINHFICEHRTSFLKILQIAPQATKDIRSMLSQYARLLLYKTR